MNKFGETVRFLRSVKPHHATTFARTVVPEVVRPARIIWNQAIGALFLILAVPAVMKVLQILRGPKPDEQGTFALMLSVVFATIMIGFGLGSLLRARRIASSALKSRTS